MARLIDTLTWIQNGERGEATVYNRALKELVELIDNGEIQAASSVQGFTVNASRINSTVTDGMVVYIHTDGIFYPTLGSDDTKSDVIGIYRVINGIHTIQTGGVLPFTGAVSGIKYYLSKDVLGGITSVQSDGTIQIASGIDTDKILIASIGGSGTGSGSSLSVDPSMVDSSVQDGDLVYLNDNGKLYPATIDNKVIGIYSSGTLIFSGIIERSSSVNTEYYSSSTAGQITDVPVYGSIKIGYGLSSELMVLDIQSDIEYTSKVLDNEFIATQGQTLLETKYNPDCLFVYIEGNLLNKTSYTATNGTSITFNSGLYEGDTIRVITFKSLLVNSSRYNEFKFTATAGQTDFDTLADLDMISVYKNGLFLNESEYSITGTVVTLNPCLEGDEIIVRDLDIAFEVFGGAAKDDEVVKLTGDQTIAGVKTFSSTISGNINGNAGTATKLATARTINGVAFDGTANIDALPARLGSSAQIITDWNSAVENGWYMGYEVLNAPNAGWNLGIVEAHNPIWVTQTVHSFTVDSSSNSEVWRRQNNGGTWGNWYRLQLNQEEQDARYVNLSGNQTIDGVKTFSSSPISTAAQSTAANALTRKDYVDTRAPLNSPALTGTPTAPTPSSADNSTKIATTAFAQPRLISGANIKTINSTSILGSGNIDVAPTTANVLTATAGATAGAVGTYTFAYRSSGTGDIATGATLAGSSLRPCSAFKYLDGGDANLSAVGNALSGTWLCMGYFDQRSSGGGGFGFGATLWLRIA